MRFTPLLQKKFKLRAQYENSYHIPFQDLHRLELEDRFTARQRVDKSRPCVPQLTVLLQCFKDSDFSQTRCAEHLKNFNACMAEYNAAAATDTKTRRLTDVQSVRDLTRDEANKLLKSKPISK
ncbi:hypothetical protein ONE63_004897 [Megalurothrips usitatus]|uniref:COX assembly mitochondrial protein n=1 Tax=Megalurothrips usitatus TaxID=439358 RepID=A0AAV7X5E8_9NEOP|nr:hypothetical protein ONE63_004897 [Megalurothrips usitatus]